MSFQNSIVHASQAAYPNHEAYLCCLFTRTDDAMWRTFSAYCAQKHNDKSLSVVFCMTERQSRLLAGHLSAFVRIENPSCLSFPHGVVFYTDASNSELSCHVATMNHSAKNDFMFTCWVRFNRTYLRCLIDTGASHSIIDLNAAVKSSHSIDNYAVVPALRGANGTHLALEGTVTGNLFLGKYKARRQSLIVMKGMLQDYDIILGMDWIVANKCDILASQRKMVINSKKQGVFTYDETFFANSTSPEHKCSSVVASVSALKRLIRTGAKLILANVKHTDVSGNIEEGHCDGYIGKGRLTETDTPLVTIGHGTVLHEGGLFPTRFRPAPSLRIDTSQSPKDSHRGFDPSHESCTTRFAFNDKCVPRINAPSNHIAATSSSTDTFHAVQLDSKLDPELQAKLSDLPDKLQRVLKRYWKVFQPLLPGLQGKYKYPGEVIPTVPHTPPFKPMYRLSPAELEEVKKQVTLFLEKGWIRPSDSPYGAPILFAQKADGSLRMCVDYRAVNKITVKNRFPLPHIQDLLDMLHGARYFSSLDLVSGYHQIALQESDVKKTAFRTPLGHFECLVLWEGLANAPSVFQSIMQRVLSPFLGKFAALYIDDILVFSKTQEEHIQHLELVFKALEDAELHVKLAKCSFMQHELRFLGHIVSSNGTRMDPKKIKAVLDWPVPTNTKQLQQFLGLCNYFRRYIKDYATIASPLSRIQNTKGKWPNGLWNDDVHGKAFRELVHALTSRDVVLALPDMQAAMNGTKPFTVMCDASKVGAGAVLLQENRPVAYFSKQFTSTEVKFGAGDREMCAIIFALREWRCYLEGTKFVLKTDHEPLTYFETVSQLSRRKASYLDFLSRFTYDFVHIKGPTNTVADCLSRDPRWDTYGDNAHVVLVTRGGARTSDEATTVPQKRKYNPFADAVNEQQANIRAEQIHAQARAEDAQTHATVPAEEGINPFLSRILIAYAKDPAFKNRRALHKYVKTPAGLYMVPPAKVKKHKDHVGLTQSQIVVPNDSDLREALISSVHDPGYGGHRGAEVVTEMLTRDYYWHGMVEDVKRYIAKCDSCQRNKSRTVKQYGLMQPLQIPTRKWGSVSMDMIVSLPKTRKQHDAILVIVDRLTKFCHFIPCRTDATAKQCAQMFHEHVTKHFGLPDEVISDRDPRFGTGAFITEVWKLFGARQCPSTAYRPQSDGQTERTNRTLHEYLRAYISSTHKDWDEHLANAQFAMNNSYQASIGCSPFLLNFGFHPRTPTTLHILKDSTVPEASEFVSRIQDCLDKAKRCLQSAQDRMKVQYDKNKQDVSFNPGDEVLLSSKNLKLAGCAKYIPRYVGPFKVLQCVGKLACKLQLPEGWKIHDVFHVSLLKPYIRGKTSAPPPTPALLDDHSYVIDSIVEHRFLQPSSQLQFRVHHLNSSPENDVWEFEQDVIKQYPLLVADYKRVKALE